MLQLGVVLGSDFCHGLQQGVNDFQINLQVMLPRWKIHVGKADSDLSADFGVIENRDIVLFGIKVC